MFPYVKTYVLAWGFARYHLRKFDVGNNERLLYTVKAGNLATCFLGLSIHRHPETYKRSAELGMLAAVFDLVSDRLKYDPKALDLFAQLAKQEFDQPVTKILIELMDRKKAGDFRLAGLDRGVGAFRVLIKHLRSEPAWQNDLDIVQTGILLQVVDDLTDYEHDLKRGELNFLNNKEFHYYINELVSWDYKSCFRESQYPLVLFFAIKRAKSLARNILMKQAPRR